MTALPRLTTHQKATLLRLCRLADMYGPTRRDRWILAGDCGGPAALDHLYFKGYAEREVRRGPRGGEHLYYRPTAEGWAVREKHAATARTPVADREMTTGEIDARLADARRRGEPVCVYVSPTVYYRAVPGEVYRKGVGVAPLVLRIGAREVPLTEITKVADG